MGGEKALVLERKEQGKGTLLQASSILGIHIRHAVNQYTTKGGAAAMH